MLFWFQINTFIWIRPFYVDLVYKKNNDWILTSLPSYYQNISLFKAENSFKINTWCAYIIWIWLIFYFHILLIWFGNIIRLWVLRIRYIQWCDETILRFNTSFKRMNYLLFDIDVLTGSIKWTNQVYPVTEQIFSL